MAGNEKTREKLQEEIDHLRSQLTDLMVEQVKRKQAEDELWESERRFLRLLDGLPMAVFVLDAQGKPYYQNKSSRELLGKEKDLQAEKRTAETYGAYLAGTDQAYPNERAPLLRALAGETSTVDDMEIRRPDKTILLEVSGSPIFDAQGNVKYAVAVFEDITDRKRAQEALRTSEGLNRAVIENSPVGITVRKWSGELVLYNEAWKKIWALTEEEIQENERNYAGRSFEERYPHLRQWAQDASRLYQSGGELLIPEGETKSTKPVAAEWVSTRLYAIQNAEGKVDQVVTLTEDITARKRIEQALRQSEERYRSLMDNLNVGIYRNTPGPKGKFIEVNPALVKMFGYDHKEELFEINVSDLYERPEDRTQINEKLLRDGSVRNEVLRLKKQDGTPLWAAVTAVSVRDEHGKVIYYDGIIEDITERRRAEEQIKNQYSILHGIIGSTDALIFSLDRDYRYTNFNQNHAAMMKAIYGVDIEMGRSMLDYLKVEKDQKTAKGNLDRALQGESVVESAYSGDEELSRRYFEVSHNPIRDPEGKIIGVAVLAKDQTGRKRAEEALRESEEKFRIIFEQAADMILLMEITPEGIPVIRDVNSATFRLLGYERNELIGQPVSFISAEPDACKVVEERRGKVLSGSGAYLFEARHRCKDGTIRDFECSVREKQIGSNIFSISVERDITERKRADKELRTNIEQLRRTTESAVQALGMMVEMRDPYTAGHQRQVADLACAIAQEMGLSEDRIEGLRFAARIHDVGKIQIPAEILTRPGPLSDHEVNLIRMHPKHGHDILKTIDFPWPVAEITWQHHERLDGSGYPRGLAGDEILLEARILGVADAVASMTFHRPYRPGHGIEKALEEIAQNRGTRYDAQAVDACLRLFSDKRFDFE